MKISYRDLLEKHGQEVKSRFDAKSCFSDGDYVFAFHEMDKDSPELVLDDAWLNCYAPDRLLAVAADVPGRLLGHARIELSDLAIDAHAAQHNGDDLADASLQRLDEARSRLSSLEALVGELTKLQSTRKLSPRPLE